MLPSHRGAETPFNREGSMRKVYFTAAAAFILAAGVGAWVASTTYARVIVPKAIVRIDTLQLTKAAGKLPVEEFKDYSVVFD
jgi:hypothetical protein